MNSVRNMFTLTMLSRGCQIKFFVKFGLMRQARWNVAQVEFISHGRLGKTAWKTFGEGGVLSNKLG